jgi:GTPase Era involved in 16S rRNA processing
MTNPSLPHFAVVGHPNKGKSSLVSTLARDENIHISSRSGTTEDAQTYTIKTQNGSYSLVDTPGFQRPNKVLKWLQQHQPNASQRQATVKQFVNDSHCQQAFRDEVELLKPIVNGAAILYVVDGSRPYGSDYEAEMEILRWTGQPSMALINPIENSNYIDEWENALSQYFKSVQVFNPFSASFEKQIALLNVFTHLNPAWNTSLQNVVKDLTEQRQQLKNQSADVLARLLDDLCKYQYCQKLAYKNQGKQLLPMLEKHFTEWMINREKDAINELLTIYARHQVDYAIDHLALPPNLFNENEWYAWGLNKKQLVSAATIAGAVSGAAIDLAVAGSSFMVGAIGGGILGAGSTLLGANKLTELKVKGLPVGGYQACIGPIKHRNFPYVVIGRFIHLYTQIANQNHADRRAIDAKSTDFQNSINTLEKSMQKDLHSACDKLIKQKTVDDLDEILVSLFDT